MQNILLNTRYTLIVLINTLCLHESHEKEVSYTWGLTLETTNEQHTAFVGVHMSWFFVRAFELYTTRYLQSGRQ